MTRCCRAVADVMRELGPVGPSLAAPLLELATGPAGRPGHDRTALRARIKASDLMRRTAQNHYSAPRTAHFPALQLRAISAGVRASPD
jgi:hypothetical protein